MCLPARPIPSGGVSLGDVRDGLLGRSLSPDISQTEKRSEDWAWVLTAQMLGAKRRTLQRRLRRKGQCLQPVVLIPNISEVLCQVS